MALAIATLGVLAAILVVFGITKAYFQYRFYDKPYVIKNSQSHYATHSGTNTIVVEREFIITRPMHFHITREIAKCLGGELVLPEENEQDYKPKCKGTAGTLIRVDLEDNGVDYDTDLDGIKVKRYHVLPAIEPGSYYLLNRVCWEENILRKPDCVNLPPLELEIFPEQYGERIKPKSKILPPRSMMG